MFLVFPEFFNRFYKQFTGLSKVSEKNKTSGRNFSSGKTALNRSARSSTPQILPFSSTTGRKVMFSFFICQ